MIKCYWLDQSQHQNIYLKRQILRAQWPSFGSQSVWEWPRYISLIHTPSGSGTFSGLRVTDQELDTSLKFLRQIITWHLSWDSEELKRSAAGDEGMQTMRGRQRGSRVSPEEAIPQSGQTWSGPVDAVLGADHFLLSLSVEPTKLELPVSI